MSQATIDRVVINPPCKDQKQYQPCDQEPQTLHLREAGLLLDYYRRRLI